MSIEENKRIILGFFENLSAGNGDAVMNTCYPVAVRAS